MSTTVDALQAQLAAQKTQLELLQQQLANQQQLPALFQQLINNQPPPGDHHQQQANTGVSSQIPPPAEFSFVASEWTQWITRYDQFRDAAAMTTLQPTAQVNHFLYVMGEKANSIMSSFNLSEEDSKDYATVKKRFDDFFVAKKTKRYERMRFNTRVQAKGEPVDTFITDLHTIGKKCEFGSQEILEDLVIDRIIAGMLDRKVSTTLQNLDSEPTLEQVVNRVRQAEVVQKNQHLLRPTDSSSPVEVNNFNHHKNHQRRSFPIKPAKPHQNLNRDPPQKKITPQQTPSSVPQETNRRCGWCGCSTRHPRPECPAINDTCTFCGIVGHWSKVCGRRKRQNSQGKQLHSVEQNDHVNEPQVNSLFFESLTIGQIDDSQPTHVIITKCPPLMVDIMINHQPVPFKVDTGADASVIGTGLFQEIKAHLPELQPIQYPVYGPDQRQLPVDGILKKVTLSYQNQFLETDLYVMQGNKTPLLGRPEIVAFNIRLTQAAISELAEPTAPEAEFADVFRGLGKMPGQYHIQLIPDARAVAVSTPRHTAIPLRGPIEAELQSMLAEGIIERVERSTPWCSPIVPVVKPPVLKDGVPSTAVRITVDFTELNKFLHRELYQLPTVDECFSLIAGCKFFPSSTRRRATSKWN